MCQFIRRRWACERASSDYNYFIPSDPSECDRACAANCCDSEGFLVHCQGRNLTTATAYDIGSCPNLLIQWPRVLPRDHVVCACGEISPLRCRPRRRRIIYQRHYESPHCGDLVHNRTPYQQNHSCCMRAFRKLGWVCHSCRVYQQPTRPKSGAPTCSCGHKACFTSCTFLTANGVHSFYFPSIAS